MLTWKVHLKTQSPKVDGLNEKTVRRKLTALINFFGWFVSIGAMRNHENPMDGFPNLRVKSPLPEVLFETECGQLLATASGDPRMYLLFMLFLETGIKFKELFGMKVSHFDFSNTYAPEMYAKRVGKKERKSWKLKLTMEIQEVFTDYVAAYKMDELLFQYTTRFIRYLITKVAEKAVVKKRVSAQILRDTCAVRQLKRGERIETVLERLGLSESTWEDAREKYLKLVKGGI